MYAQALEGDTWKGEKMDKGKIEKMSGRFATCFRCSVCVERVR